MSYKKTDSKSESDFYSLVPADLLAAKLPPTTKLVFAAIAGFYRGNDSMVFPSYNRIAGIVGISRNTAIVAVKQLVAAGFLFKNPRMRDDGGFTSNLYTFSPSNEIALPSNDTITSPSNDTITSPSNEIAPRLIKKSYNNNLFKINNIRAYAREMATGAATESAPERSITDKDREVLEIAKTQQVKSWFELVRIQQTYYLRPVSNKVYRYVTEDQAENLRLFIEEKAGSCRGLKYGQHNEKEVIIQ